MTVVWTLLMCKNLLVEHNCLIQRVYVVVGKLKHEEDDGAKYFLFQVARREMLLLLLLTLSHNPHSLCLTWPVSNFLCAFCCQHRRIISHKKAGLSLIHCYKKMLQGLQRKAHRNRSFNRHRGVFLVTL